MIDTSKIFKEGDLDKGFILRANDQVARVMREIIHSNSTDQLSFSRKMEVINLDPKKRIYG